MGKSGRKEKGRDRAVEEIGDRGDREIGENIWRKVVEIRDRRARGREKQNQ